MSKKDQKTPAVKSEAVRKVDRALDLLRRDGGASLAELTEATGWLPHSARAVLTSFRKRGYTLDKSKVDACTRYSITGEPAA